MLQQDFAREVDVIGVYVIEPVYLLGSTPPKVSSPFPLEREVVGLKEIPTTSDEILHRDLGIWLLGNRAVGQACRAEAKKAINILKAL